MLSPFLACVLSSAKIRSCLRIRLAPSISIVLAMSRSSETCVVLSSERCMGRKRSRANTTKGGLAGPMNDAGAGFWELPAPRKEGGGAGNRSPALKRQHRLTTLEAPARALAVNARGGSVEGERNGVRGCCQERRLIATW